MTVEEKAALSSLEEAISSAETDSNLLDSIAPEEETEINNFGTSGFENNFTSAAISQDNFELFEGAAVKKDSILDTIETEAVAEKVCKFFSKDQEISKAFFFLKLHWPKSKQKISKDFCPSL